MSQPDRRAVPTATGITAGRRPPRVPSVLGPGELTAACLVFERCGTPVGPRDVWARPGEGASADHPLRRRGGVVSRR
jgi:hypothetical protein